MTVPAMLSFKSVRCCFESRGVMSLTGKIIHEASESVVSINSVEREEETATKSFL